LKARVAFGPPDQEALAPPGNALERRYALRAVKQRLHQVKSLAAVRGRAGIVLERAMWYVAAGWGYGDVRYDRVFQPAGIPFTSGVAENRSGFTAASGVVVAISDYLIGRFQYEYFDLGKPTYAVGVLSNTDSVVVKTQVHTFTLGLAYKFNGGPVVAKY
jgi:outer membrane immunogenic protein